MLLMATGRLAFFRFFNWVGRALFVVAAAGNRSLPEQNACGYIDKMGVRLFCKGGNKISIGMIRFRG